MRPARTVLAAVAAVAAMTGLGAPARADGGITVWPATPRPGQRIHISVPGCSVGPTPHTARSAAFTRAVTLYGKADTGEADPRVRKGLRPGRYPVLADCGSSRTVRGQVVVTAGGPGDGTGTPPATVYTEPPRSGTATISATPAASRSHGGGSGPLYWTAGAAVLVLAGGAGLLALRRRRTP